MARGKSLRIVGGVAVAAIALIFGLFKTVVEDVGEGTVEHAPSLIRNASDKAAKAAPWLVREAGEIGTGRIVSEANDALDDDLISLVSKQNNMLRLLVEQNNTLKTLLENNNTLKTGTLQSRLSLVLPPEPAPGSEVTAKVSDYYNSASDKIVSLLSTAGPSMTKEEITRIINDRLAEAIAAAARKDPAIEFKLSSGKLTVNRSINVGNVKVSFGEVNLLKVSMAVAGGIYACRALTDLRYEDCVKRALAKAHDYVAAAVASGEAGTTANAKSH